MSCLTIFTTTLAILASFLACNMALLSLASIDSNFRNNIDTHIQKFVVSNRGLMALQIAVEIWLRSFLFLFGRRFITWRFFVLTPIYTILVTAIMSILWIGIPVITYYIQNGKFGFLSEWMKEGIRQWLSYGIWIAIGMDYIYLCFSQK